MSIQTFETKITWDTVRKLKRDRLEEYLMLYVDAAEKDLKTIDNLRKALEREKDNSAYLAKQVYE